MVYARTYVCSITPVFITVINSRIHLQAFLVTLML